MPGAGRYTPADFPLAQLGQNRLDQLQLAEPLLEDLYPLTGMQQGLVFHNLLDNDREAYTTQLYFDLERSFQPSLFQRAWEQVLPRHAIFRTAFVDIDRDKPLQAVLKSVNLNWDHQDLRHLAADQQDIHFESYRRADKAKGFDFDNAPMMRMSLFRLSDERYRWMWTHHHSVLDGWSLPIVFKELFTYYSFLLKGATPSLPSVTPFREYVAWLDKQDRSTATEFWKQALSGFESPTQIGIDQSYANGDTAECREQVLRISESRSNSLVAVSQQYGVTLNILTQAVWSYLLYRYSGDETIVFGQTIAGRPADIAGIENMVGMFLNTLPVRVDIKPGQSIKSWLQAMHHAQVERESHGYIPLTDIQRLSQITADQSLFDTLLIFENYPVIDTLQEEQSEAEDELGFKVSGMDSDEVTGYGLTLTVIPGRELVIKFGFNAMRFTDIAVNRLIKHMDTIFDGLINPDIECVGALPYLSEAELQQQLVGWNTTEAAYPHERCIHELFEAQVEYGAHRIALIEQNHHVSFGELNARANQLAHYLIAEGVTLESRVGLCFERSIGLVVAILGTIKAGAAYVPIDSGYPEERIRYVLEDAGVARVLSTTALESTLSAMPVECLALDDPHRRAAVAAQSPVNIAKDSLGLQPDNLSCLIYTSGSTGRPKGVMGVHRSIVNRVNWLQGHVGVGHDEVLCQKTSVSFVDHVAEIFQALSTGVPLVIVPTETLQSAGQLAGVLTSRHISQLTLVPSLLQTLLASDELCVPSLKVLYSSGEALSLKNLDGFKRSFPNARLFNV